MSKKMFVMMMVLAAVLSLGYSSFAVVDAVLTASIGDAISAIVDNVIGCITVVAPIGITIFGAMLAWKYGKKFFKTIAG